MTIKENTNYYVCNQEDYDAFMKLAEEQGFKWNSGNKPTELNYFDGSRYVINTGSKSGGCGMTHCDIDELLSK